jgi:hypothetical protein
LPVPIGCEVYQTLVRPLLEYAAEVTSIYEWKQADDLQTSMAKRILQCPIRTPNAACRGELGWLTMEGRYQQIRVGFYAKIIRTLRGAPLREVYEESMRLSAASDAGDLRVPEVPPSEGWEVVRPPSEPGRMTLWCEQIKCDLYQLGLAEYWRQPESLRELTPTVWLARVKAAVRIKESVRWWKEISARPMLRTYVTLKLPRQLKLESYLTVPHGGWNDRVRMGRAALTRLRCGANELRIDTGRHEGLAAEHRICRLCAEAVETERHFLLSCSFLRVERIHLWRELERLVQHDESIGSSAPATSLFRADRLSGDEKFTLLSGGGHPLIDGKRLGQRVMIAVLIAIADWIARRAERIALIDQPSTVQSLH